MARAFARSRRMCALSRPIPRPKTRAPALREGAAALVEPLVFELDELEVTEGYIEIREGNDGKVITVIEFLSPSNKRRGAGQDQYLQKQAELLASDTSLVEIDLVRSGQRVLALPADQIPIQHRDAYLACVSPGWNRRRRELYPMPLRQRLPVLPIPLRRQEPPLTLAGSTRTSPCSTRRTNAARARWCRGPTGFGW
jgi:hypothetical protein